MSEITNVIQKLLDLKEKIDEKNVDSLNMVSYDKWLVSAVSLLLKIEMMKEKEKEKKAGVAQR